MSISPRQNGYYDEKSEIMSIAEFRRGMLRLADNRLEACIARRLVASYAAADDAARADCSRMLREDLAVLPREGA